MSKWYLKRCCSIKSAHLGFPFWAFGRHLGRQPSHLLPGEPPALSPRLGCRWSWYWTTFTVQKAWHSLLPVGGKANWEVCIKAVMSSIYMYWLEVGPPFLIYHHPQLWNFPHVDWHGSYSRSLLVLYCFFLPLPLLNRGADPPAGMAW